MMKISNIEKTISCNLSYQMKRKKMNFAGISDITGISIRTLKRYAMGEILPKLDKAFDISTCLGVGIEQIWTISKI